MNRIKDVNVSEKKDKILVWIGAELLHYFLINGLQKKYDADYYAIIDITNNPKEFFQNQNFTEFKKIWFYHDEIKSSEKSPDLHYLKKFEEENKIDLWKIALNERIFYRFNNFHKFSSDEILKIDEMSIRFFQRVLDEINPDYFLTKQPSFHHLELFKEMCKKTKCKILMLSPPKLGFKAMLSQDVTTIDYFPELESVSFKERSFSELRDYLDSYSGHSQLKQFYKKIEKRNSKDDLNVVMEYLMSTNKNIETNYNYYGRTKFKVLSDIFFSKIRKKSRENFLEKNLMKNVDLKKSFIYFPMSTDLERYLLIDSPFYTNQIEVIRHVAKSVPSNYQLYVKENPSNVTRDWREISQYKEIIDIPNVKLIHPSFSNKELLANCSLVISIAGSSSFEAAFYEKPSIVFGNVLYKELPSVYKIKEIEKLPMTIKEALNDKVDVNDLNRFLAILEKNTFDFDMVEFVRLISEKFYSNDASVDVKINDSDVSDFINKNDVILQLLVEEHLKKINQHKKFVLKSS